MLRERGETALSARTVAERAGCSVQPIYSLFGDMRGLVRALYDHARAWVAAYNREHVDDGRNAFEANGLSHLRLARTERHLFQFLYLSPHMEATSFAEVYESVAVDGVQQCIEELGHLSPAAARALYLHMIVYLSLIHISSPPTSASDRFVLPSASSKMRRRAILLQRRSACSSLSS